MNPLLLVDFYKPSHYFMYPKGMTKLYSNFTPRKSRLEGIDKVVVFSIQHFCLEYLIKQFNDNFFKKNKKEVIEEYSRHVKQSTYAHIEALHDLGYLPIEIKSLDEGTLCPIGVPMLTITNTHPDFGWLVNYLETLISCMLWQPITSATIAYEYKKILNKYALETTGNTEGVQWQGHDFSMRGMSSVESAILSGMGHLTSFTGTDTIPAIYQLEQSYKAQGLIGASVPATEHSVMCMGTKESEIETFRRLIKLYPTGILSVVSDTWNLWDVCTKFLPELKEEILARDGKLVIRPDSGDPVDIICGLNSIISFDSEEFWELYQERENFNFQNDNIFYKFDGNHLSQLFEEYGEETNDVTQTIKDLLKHNIISKLKIKPSLEQSKGVIELLWDIFGGTVNEQGYKISDPHIGAIYGDSITLDRAAEICERLKAKGFASTNIVLGIGSFTYQYNTRDTFGFAMKATYGEITHERSDYLPTQSPEATEPAQWTEIEPREIFKDPITDDGTKKSLKGRLLVTKSVEKGLMVVDQIKSWEQCENGELTTVFKDGKLVKETSLDEIRAKLNGK